MRPVLEPIFAGEFAAHSDGFRPGRGTTDARRRVATLRKAGHVWGVDADQKSDCATISHEHLLALVRERVADGRVLALAERFLRAGGWPRKKSLAKLPERVRANTARLDGRSRSEIVTHVNRTLRGWYGYFQHRQANPLTAVDGYVRRRLRSLLPWRLDGVGTGIGATHQRWPKHWFARSGLWFLATAHEWPRTIVPLRTH